MRGASGVAVALLVLTVLLSGCFVEDDPTTQSDDTSGSVSASSSSSALRATVSATGSKSSTSTGSSTPAAAPTANLTASGVNGTAPYNVTFALSGKVASGRNTTWVLQVDASTFANGTTLPANVTYSFTAAGEYLVELNVFDGVRNATANVTITVLAAAAAVADGANTLCPTDGDAIEIPGAGYYMTPMDSLEDPPFSLGSMWIYEESNGIDGLQRNDDTRPTDCPTPDTIIF